MQAGAADCGPTVNQPTTTSQQASRGIYNDDEVAQSLESGEQTLILVIKLCTLVQYSHLAYIILYHNNCNDQIEKGNTRNCYVYLFTHSNKL
jgi:hypothetical protein